MFGVGIVYKFLTKTNRTHADEFQFGNDSDELVSLYFYGDTRYNMHIISLSVSVPTMDFNVKLLVELVSC